MSSTDTDGRADDAAPQSAGEASPVDARIYRVLGEQFLSRPDHERVDAVGAWAREWLVTAESLPVEIETGLERIVDGSEDDIETLRTAYTHLFRGISRDDPDPPYESMYAGGGGFYSETTTEIRQGYRWAGVDVDTTVRNEPPDHLGLELQFLGELVAADEQAGEPDEPDIADAEWWLLDEHLTEWLPGYYARIQREEPAEYYAGILDLALAVVKARHGMLARER